MDESQFVIFRNKKTKQFKLNGRKITEVNDRNVFIVKVCIEIFIFFLIKLLIQTEKEKNIIIQRQNRLD